MGRKIIYSYLFVLLGFITCLGQSYTLRYVGSDSTLRTIEKFQPLHQHVSDSLSAIQQTRTLLFDLHNKGYIRAQVEEVKQTDSIFYVMVKLGARYKWAALRPGNIPEILLSKVGFREKFFRGRAFRYPEVARLFKKIVVHGENNGYPFTAIAMDSVQVEGHVIKAALHYDSGPLITYDSIVINGSSKIKSTWLASYLDIPYGKPFSQRAVGKINARVQNLLFTELVKPVEMTFQNSQATISLHVKDVEANHVDGIIGFLPNAQDNGSLLVTGQFDLALTNLFNSGKRLGAAWQRLKPLSQFLHLNYVHPNLMRSPLHLRTSFELLKEDTTFINRHGYLAFNYQSRPHEITFFTRLKASRLLSTSEFGDAATLPDIADFNLNYYGVIYDYSKWRQRGLIKTGMGANIELAIGDKKIKKNASLPSEVYEGAELKSVQYQLQGVYQYFIPLSKQLVVHQKLSGGKIFNDRLFLNDLFRLGGLKTLRGFNENFFFASEYLVSTLELQLYYDLNSYIFIFYDQSYLYFNIGERSFEDYPLGLGAGINLMTKAGVVSLAYAIGRSEEQALSMRLSKFHFGYIAKF